MYVCHQFLLSSVTLRYIHILLGCLSDDSVAPTDAEASTCRTKNTDIDGMIVACGVAMGPIATFGYEQHGFGYEPHGFDYKPQWFGYVRTYVRMRHKGSALSRKGLAMYV